MQTLRFGLLFYLLCLCLPLAFATPIDSLEYRLRLNTQVQEKVYIHTDNRSYFQGDTLWYKAYVLRADNLNPTDMSKILYVELLTPDGYLVERQRVIIDHNTQSCGQFALPDTLYSGYYELRAYTRWQLNFNVTERFFNPHNGMFVAPEYAKDYFRNFEGLYSRVIPVYEKNDEPGNYKDRWIVGRPKRRLPHEKEKVTVQFYPEGGMLVQGVTCRVAYEVLDETGMPLSISGKLNDGTEWMTDKDGRGLMEITPQGTEPIRASLTWQKKEYSFVLPPVQREGAVLRYDPEKKEVEVVAKDVKLGGLSVCCRGKLVHFTKDVNRKIGTKDWPTGVNEIVVYDSMARPLAVRQIFVNQKDGTDKLKVSYLCGKKKYPNNLTCKVDSFQRVTLHGKFPKSGLKGISLSVCDRMGDEPSFDDGNIMTDLLLTGDLKGFVAHPAYYFESDDKEHRRKLDLLMMIQGWKKYDIENSIRYQPEKNLTVEGYAHAVPEPYQESPLVRYFEDNCKAEDLMSPCFYGHKYWKFYLAPLPKEKKEHRRKTTPLSESEAVQQKKVIVEAELIKDNGVASVAMEADDDGHFRIHIPPFYGSAELFLTAYQRADSALRCLASRDDKYKYNPLFSPYYQIKQNAVYPTQARRYNWYETHSPLDGFDWKTEYEEPDEITDGGDGRQLENVTVKARQRRGLRKFTKDKPAMEIDFWSMYNELIDNGIHNGSFNAIVYWEEVVNYLFADFFYWKESKISAMVDGHYFLKPRPTPPYPIVQDLVGVNKSPVELQRLLKPSNIGRILVYTDLDKRNMTGLEKDPYKPYVWFNIFSLESLGQEQRPVFRDRRIILDGFAYPEQFYHRDYSGVTPTDSTDYRRTLYWNPNAHPDKDGNLKIQFYNGARPAYLKVSMCGVSEDGIIYMNE